MKQLVLTNDEYEELCGIFAIALKASDSVRLRSEVQNLYTRIQLIAIDCSNPFRAGQADIISQMKQLLEIES
jgi:hypothetical protein